MFYQINLLKDFTRNDIRKEEKRKEIQERQKVQEQKSDD